MRIIEGLVQGSPEWKAVRAKYPCASEAPIVMGASRHMTRGELLRLKAAGMEKEFSDYVQRMVLDKGHEVEDPARTLTERQIGEDLFPATAVSDDDGFLASLDGITMLEDVIFEHKQWNEELAAAIRAGATEFPDGQEWQLEQQLLVADSAEKVIFVCSDGTEERRVQMEYRRVPGRAEQLKAGWAQFHADLAAGVAPPAPPKAVAAPLELLPAVNVRMEGALKVVSNLDTFEPLLRTFIDRIPAKPSTDEEFATTDAACKVLKKVEEELDRSEAAALASLDAVEQMQRLKATLHKLARDTRLQREKLVEARKVEIRQEEIARGKQALADFIAGLNATIGKPYMPAVPNDFTGAIRGKKTVQSLRDAVDQHLADCKLAAGEVAQRIQVNMATLRELATEHAFLFADTQQLVLKAPDDCRAVIVSRISEHKTAEERRAAELAERERARIRAEEEARARAQAQREQQEREAAERRQREEQEALARRQEHDAAAAAAMKAIGEAERAESLPPQLLGTLKDTVVSIVADTAINRAAESAANVVPMPTKAPAAPTTAPAGPPTLKLGDINTRIGLGKWSEEDLRILGFPAAARERNACMYHEHDFKAILAAIAQHVVAVANGKREVAA